ncbi:GNAT family protein [Paenibacillus campi]|uniref:GNAT family N-acetyltransferase n=1 Tax=Paenibacillus campi TaxID=3106031 RepID=UPI002AFFC9E8|nr:GNAT family protein [Paenibacillus sp. SGZ-1009]
MQTEHSGIELRPLHVEHAEALLQLRLDNREYMQVYEPVRPQYYWTLDTQRELLEQGEQSLRAGSGYVFGMFRFDNGQLVGRIELSGVARGPFQNAGVGYFVDRQHHGHGYATTALRWVTEYAFRKAGLHRIQAGVLPWNEPSKRVLEKVGFRNEGLAKRYLCINGSWEDHLLYAITAEEWDGSESVASAKHR